MRRHDSRHRRIQLSLKSKIAARHDADGLFLVDDWHARDSHSACEFDNLPDRHIRSDRDRIANDSALIFLDDRYLSRLIFDRHVFVDNAETTFLCQGDRESRLSHGIHRRRQERNVQCDFGRQAGTEINFSRQHLGIAGLQEYVVKS